MSDSLATTNEALKAFDAFGVLSIHDDNDITPVTALPDALGTISAGYKDGNKPVVSRDGQIYLHDPSGHCAYLASLLNSNNKRLVVTPAFDDPTKCIKQSFRRYSASKLEVYGDTSRMVEIVGSGDKAEHIEHEKGTPRYTELKKSCKVNISFYFFLAAWNKDGTSRIILNDGAGFYRMRTTSPQSIQNIVSQMRNVAGYTGGSVSGVPFDLFHGLREKVAGDGSRRNVPIWSMVMRPPQGLELDITTYRKAMTSGIKQASMLYLDPPKDESFEVALNDVEVDIVDSLSDENAGQYQHRLKQWHGMVKNTVLEPDDAQMTFLASWSSTLEYGPYDSRSEAAKYLSEEDWSDLLTDANTYIREVGQEAIQAQAEQDNSNPNKYSSDITQGHISTLNRIVSEVGIKATDALDFIAWLSGDKLTVKRDISPETVDKAEIRFTELAESIGNSNAIIEAFEKHRSSDEEVAGLLA